jgi:hypothetical protein
MSKNIDDELDSIKPESTGVPLTEEEIKKIELKKKVIELRKKYIDQTIVVTKNNVAKPANTLTIEEQTDEFLRCAVDPIYFIETYLTVFDQTQGDGGRIVPFKLFEFQKEIVLAYQKHKENVANKYRQAGVSTTTCAFIAWYVMFHKDRYVAVIADKLETARDELMSDIKDFIDNCPAYLRPKVGNKDSAHHMRYANGSQMKAFAATKLRGPTPTLVCWDETAWTEKGEKFWESAGAAVRNTGGRVIFVSTPNGLDPIFYKTFETARTKGKPFNAIELWWYNDPRYNQALSWVKNEGKDNEIRIADTGFSKEQRKKMIADGFQATSPWFENAKAGYNGDNRRLAQEILCSFLGSGDNFISEEFIQRIEQEELRQPIRTEYNDRLMWIFEDPIPDAKYVMSCDAASGYGEDYSTINILKITDNTYERTYVENGVAKLKKINRRISEQVAEYYGKVSPQQLAEIAYYYGSKYNQAYAVVDTTGGYGVATIESLKSFGYLNLHFSEIIHKPTKDRLNVYAKTITKQLADGSYVKVDQVPGFYIGTNRPLILQELEKCVRMQDVIIRSVRMTNEFKTFITVENPARLADHRRTFHDDDIMSLAIGLYVVNWNMMKHDNTEKIKTMLNAILVVNDADHLKPNENKGERSDDYVVHRNNPAASYNWLFKGLDKRR